MTNTISSDWRVHVVPSQTHLRGYEGNLSKTWFRHFFHTSADDFELKSVTPCRRVQVYLFSHLQSFGKYDIYSIESGTWQYGFHLRECRRIDSLKGTLIPRSKWSQPPGDARDASALEESVARMW